MEPVRGRKRRRREEKWQKLERMDVLKTSVSSSMANMVLILFSNVAFLPFVEAGGTEALSEISIFSFVSANVNLFYDIKIKRCELRAKKYTSTREGE